MIANAAVLVAFGAEQVLDVPVSAERLGLGAEGYGYVLTAMGVGGMIAARCPPGPVGEGAAAVVFDVVALTLLQRATPESATGRVFSLSDARGQTVGSGRCSGPGGACGRDWNDERSRIGRPGLG